MLKVFVFKSIATAGLAGIFASAVSIEPNTLIPIGSAIAVVWVLLKLAFDIGGKLKGIQDQIKELETKAEKLNIVEVQFQRIKELIYQMPCQGCPTDTAAKKPFKHTQKIETDFIRPNKPKRHESEETV